jgi:hypothetical protein
MPAASGMHRRKLVAISCLAESDLYEPHSLPVAERNPVPIYEVVNAIDRCPTGPRGDASRAAAAVAAIASPTARTPPRPRSERANAFECAAVCAIVCATVGNRQG